MNSRIIIFLAALYSRLVKSFIPYRGKIRRGKISAGKHFVNYQKFRQFPRRKNSTFRHFPFKYL